MGRLTSGLLSSEFSPRRHGVTENAKADAGSEVHGFRPGRVVCEEEQDIEIEASAYAQATRRDTW